MVIDFDVEDLAGTRFAVSPLGETTRAVALLGSPDPPSVNRPWAVSQDGAAGGAAARR